MNMPEYKIARLSEYGIKKMNDFINSKPGRNLHLKVYFYGNNVINKDRLIVLCDDVIPIEGGEIYVGIAFDKIIITSDRFICITANDIFRFENDYGHRKVESIDVEMQNIYVDGWMFEKYKHRMSLLDHTDGGSPFHECAELSSLKVSRIYFADDANISWLFANCSSLKTLTIGDDVDLSKIKSISHIFHQCVSLEKIESKNPIDLSACEVFTGAFMDCQHFSNDNHVIDNTIVKNMLLADSMFFGALNITKMNLNNWDTSNLAEATQMFGFCKELVELHVENWNVQRLRTTVSMFQMTHNLRYLDISNWRLEELNEAAGMFSACGRLVYGDNANLKLWINGGNVDKNSILHSIYLDEAYENVNCKGGKIDLSKIHNLDWAYADSILCGTVVDVVDMRNHDLALRYEETQLDIVRSTIKKLIVTFSKSDCSPSTTPLLRDCTIDEVILLCDSDDANEQKAIRDLFEDLHVSNTKIEKIFCINKNKYMY